MTEKRILLVEDEKKIADFVRRGLTLEGYQVDVVFDGDAGLDAAIDNPPDLLVLDLMLPGMDGLRVCRELRIAGFTFPILMLTARDSVPDRGRRPRCGSRRLSGQTLRVGRAAGPGAGAIAPAGRRYRRDAAIRRPGAEHVDRDVTRGDRRIELTAKEFDVLELFMRNPRQVLTRDILYERIWGYDFSGESNIIEVYVRYLRAKLEAGGEPRLIHTVRGVGYTLRDE